MPEPRPFASAGRRSLAASWGSLALHGGAVALAVVLVRNRPRPPRRAALTEIEVVDALRVPGPPVPQQIAPASPAAEPLATAHSRRGRDLPQRAPARPASARTLLAQVDVSYDDRGNFAEHASDVPSDGDHDLRNAALATGGDRPAQDGLATLQMPGTASASLARPPRPKHDYRSLQMHAVRQFAGQTIRVLLSIDNRGEVRRVDLLHGVESRVDARTIALVRQFEFEPALDEVGAPIPGYARWDILIVDETKEAIRDNLEKGYY